MNGLKFVARVPFCTINHSTKPDYIEGMNRHHLTPRQSLRDKTLRPFLDSLRSDGVHIDDFATNGILLPALQSLSRSTRLPLHSGGHPAYNLRVINELHAIRGLCESVRGDSRRRSLAAAGVHGLQKRVRLQIVKHGVGHIDRVVLSGVTDDRIDVLIDRLMAAAGTQPTDT